MDIKYSDVVQGVHLMTNIPKYKVLNVLQEVTNVVQEYISLGVGVNIDRLFSIKYKIPKRKGFIYSGKEVNWDKIVNDVFIKVKGKTTLFDTRLICNTYIDILINHLSVGDSITFKGVGYLYSCEDDEGTYIDYRISPSLKKVEKAEFIVMESEPVFKTLRYDDLYLSMDISDSIELLKDNIDANI